MIGNIVATSKNISWHILSRRETPYVIYIYIYKYVYKQYIYIYIIREQHTVVAAEVAAAASRPAWSAAPLINKRLVYLLRKYELFQES